jgi:hypothetical protein
MLRRLARPLLAFALAFLLAPSAGAGAECPAHDPECAAAWLPALTGGLGCEGKCRCEKLAAQGDLLAVALGAALAAPDERACGKALKQAGKAAKKLGRGAEKLLKKECADPPETAMQLAEAGPYLQAGLGEMLDADACASRMSPLLDAANAVSASVGPAGGVLETVGADGRRYRLEIPPCALLDEVEVTLTPALATGTPFEGGPLAAAQLEPNGLRLWVPGTLEIELPAAPDPDGLVGFGWDGVGWNLGLALMRVQDALLVFSVQHFSGLGAALAAPASLNALLGQPVSGSANTFTTQLAAACSAGDSATLPRSRPRRCAPGSGAPASAATRSRPRSGPRTRCAGRTSPRRSASRAATSRSTRCSAGCASRSCSRTPTTPPLRRRVSARRCVSWRRSRSRRRASTSPSRSSWT